MMRQRYGRIVNITSVSALMGNPGQANYSASKAGVIGFTQTIARELASRGVTVNAVAPGFITTDMTDVLPDKVKAEVKERIPVRRLGSPEDIADLVTYLASPSASLHHGPGHRRRRRDDLLIWANLRPGPAVPSEAGNRPRSLWTRRARIANLWSFTKAPLRFGSCGGADRPTY